MSLTREECENALMNLCSSNAKVKDRHVFKDLIEEHFGNTLRQLEYAINQNTYLLKQLEELKNPQPYKFDDLNDFTNALDSKINQLCLIKGSVTKQHIYVWYFCKEEAFMITKEQFEENRFFPVNVGCEHD